tara:strand:+ start:4010 stop:4648 length:639 start_codon:yes stop_codon:yes gene_type:complete
MCPPLLAAIPVIMGGAGSAGAVAAGTAASSAALASGATAAAAATAATSASAAAVTAAWGTVATATTVAASVGGTVMSAKAQNDSAEMNARNANIAAMQQDQQLNLQESQVQEKSAGERLDNATKVQQALARADMAAINSGGMLNNDAIGQSIMRQGLVTESTILQNLDRNIDQFGLERKGVRSSAQSRINSVSASSNTATGLQIAGDVAPHL